ncbi:MAG: Hsp20/alpha crystallin family protein [Planctomycetota bacterium]|nr:Hsp20/alpha crystallin family protein [Planctomycetota bacterium]
MTAESIVQQKNQNAPSTSPVVEGEYYRPDVDILERADDFLVHVDVPGAASEEIDVQFQDGALTVIAPVPGRILNLGKPIRTEYGMGAFQRTFRVNERIDASRISANYRDGVLTLQLPKADAAKPRKIEIGVN